ncbi:P-loop containing nucleoside triphosphate hydrolase [Pseudocohnilembus persalinus]|uniref:p-loop containing nucleoside triphosphate hydrolase n=1 Tax=Pseudocohnilembus persalinus TaxID=266149 RepID=A0A0V0QZT3_PSEPJ|nr:P-loop containing nucleoside triphosphate hydrolase [Pseudocohnilembus persalinus]|eukprot:KRX07798.1 P-loop containing nucleoside triphosphate hydrolase [Pseudocohnilembus persalinus]
MSTLVFLRNFQFSFVNEKTEKYKETYKIMGMQQSAYFLSWLIFTFLKGLAVVVIVSIPAVWSGAFDGVGVGYALGVFFMFMLSQLAFAYFFTTFFSQAKMAAEVYSLVTLAQIFLFCLFPSSALNISMFIGDESFELSESFTGGSIIMMLIIDTFIYFLLYLYLDQVFPNEFGTQKPWYFPIQLCFGSKKNDAKKNYSLIDQDINGENDGASDYSSAQYHELFTNPRKLNRSIEIHNLKKKFGDFYAVNGVSLCLYEQQIFCLLGHNGAGKTTTISLLTGMIELSSGKASLYGKDLVSELDQIRNNTGICNQKDVLFNNLTVTEHLKFMCDLKGMPEELKLGKIEETIQKCNLEMERHKFAKNLSGGNKRKLSLALSLIGGSKIVFLDEPSSGLDPGSRRKIWDILKQCKQENRTIVLTTHHLEEAEELADRIGIMSRGKLLTVGTSDFIKKKFGIGYQLMLNRNQKDANQQKTQQFDLNNREQLNNEISLQNAAVEKFTEEERSYFKQLILNHVKSAQYNPQTSQDKIQFALPFDERPNFPALLQKMESDNRISINLEMNNLEDAFINIGMEEQKEEEEKKELKKLKEQGVENPEEYLKNQNQAKFTNFDSIPIPEILKQPPNVTFWVQFYALYLRKFYSAIRSRDLMFAFIMPIIFIFFGIYVTKLILKDIDPTTDEYYISGSIQLSIFLIIGYCFSTGSYCSFIVTEKANKLKYALNVMGCRSSTYWLGTYSFDITVFLILQIIYIIFCFIFDFQFVTKKLFWNILIMSAFGLSYVACCHLQSHMFTSIKKAQSCSFLINFYLFFSLFFFTLLFQSRLINTLASVVSPYYLLFYALISVGQGSYQFVDQLNYMDQPYMYFIVYLVQAVVFMYLTVYIDDKKSSLNSPVQNLNQSVLQSSVIQDNDGDIKEEEKRLKTANDVVKVQNLYKTYPNGFVAIKNNSFGVDKGEIFGLLGPNGAGKSTTFNILTSLIPKSQGSVKMKGIDVNQGIMEIYENVGICPQFDCIWESLNVEEHLQLFGRMKGLTGKNLNDSVEYFMQVMQLTDYRTRKSGKLSGGNKRKLCVALALIGGPDMQFCDEPSSGVDPIARRFLWNTLTNSIKLRNSSITITTHSMQEADSLCNKIGILVNGKFQCIGTPQYLKQKYGQGYIVTFMTNQDEVVEQIINKRFPQAKVVISKDEKVQFQYDDPDIEQQQQGVNPMIHAYAQFPYDGFSFAEIQRKEKNIFMLILLIKY